MTGKSHLAVGISTAVIATDINFLINHADSTNIFSDIFVLVKDFAFDNQQLPYWGFIVLSIAFYLFGLLLPDIDYEYSMLGKIIHIPLEHRTWTHAIYLVVIFLVASIWFRPLWFLAIGIFLHDLADSVSYSGIRWFYPAKQKHVIKLYKVSTFTEYLCVIVFVVLTVFFTLFSLQHVYHFVTVKFW